MGMTALLYVILGVATVVKLGLWGYCFTLSHHSGAALALAEDHINDVVSNIGALLGRVVRSRMQPPLWGCLRHIALPSPPRCGGCNREHGGPACPWPHSRSCTAQHRAQPHACFCVPESSTA